MGNGIALGRVLLLLCAALTGGCYYAQAVRGQIEVLSKREPIDELLADESTSEALAERLRLVEDARRYSIEELFLPDNDSYTSYSDLDRSYVLWNVFAAPEFSIQPHRWCYPIVGCLAYRGYFKKERAEKVAADLAADGYDVFLGGVTAYSTLGRFDDPVLNTMLNWDDVRLVEVLFHELAHQVVYIRDDTAFNESFATAVAEAGIRRYLRDRDREDALQSYEERRTLTRELMALLTTAREDLGRLYDSAAGDAEKRLLKADRIEALTADVRTLLERYGRDPDTWLWAPFNNARLASFSVYEGHLPAFRRMLADCDGAFRCFLAEVERVADLDREARDTYLASMGSPG